MTDNEIITALEKLTAYGSFTDKVKKLLHKVIDLIFRQKEENKRLQAEIKRLEENDRTLSNVIKNTFLLKAGFDIDPLSEIKTAAVKEFAERLCEGRVSNDAVVIAVKTELKMLEGSK